MASTPTRAEQLSDILMVNASRRTDEVRSSGRRFVQYTSAEAAVSILKNRCFWMRNASCMNDYSEMRFGLEKVVEAYASPPGMRFRQILDELHPGITAELQKEFDPLAGSILSHTYLTCVSEHDDNEDDHGRLSMWRGYGAATSVAIVMNSHAFVTPSNALNAWTTPVAYVRRLEYIEELDRVASELERNGDWVRQISREEMLPALVLMLVFSAVSLKHVGFLEEKEWRVVHLPLMFESNRLEFEHVSVAGVPQPIFKIPMRNHPEEGFTGAEPSELINRVIIGPTQYPEAVRSTFVALLAEVGVADPERLVVCSGIPLRC